MGLTRKQITMLAVLMLGTFVTVLNQTVTTPALPSIMTEMSVDAATAQWLTTGFTLVNAIMIPITAYLIDRYSIRRLFVVAMGAFTLGSLLAGWGPAFAVLLAGRLIQAAGAGILMPMVMTVLMLTFPLEKRGTAMGLFGVVIAFAPAIGPTVAGIVIDHYGWNVLFFAIALLAALIIVFSLFVLEKREAQNSGATLDKPSVVLSSLGFGALLYGFSSIGSSGITVSSVGIALIGLVVLIFFFHRQLQLEQPMLQVRVLANRTFLTGTIIGMLVQASLLASGILMPIYLQTIMGYSATTSGLVILPGAILMGVMSPIAGRLYDKYGPRALSIVGLLILTLTTIAYVFLTETTNITYVTVLYTLRLLSLSLVNMPVTTWAMSALNNKLINHGNSVNNTLRQVAGSLGTAVLISTMTIATKMSSASSNLEHATMFGINVAFAVATVLCVGGLVLAILFVKDKSSLQADVDDTRRTVLETIMKRDVYTVDTSATVLDAMKVLVDKGISAAPIVDEQGHAVGFVSDGDIMRFLSKRSQTFVDPILLIMQTEGATKEFDEKLSELMGMNVTGISRKNVISVGADASLEDVARVLGENHLKKVAVLDGENLVGVINRSDVTQYAMKTYLESEKAA